MKPKILFICASCDAQFVKWTGRCYSCGSWGTISEQVFNSVIENKPATAPAQIETLDAINANSKIIRKVCQFESLNRVLGGGFVPGSITLFTGDPGIGKSTILLQIAAQFKNALYLSAEESKEQVLDKIKRLQLDTSSLYFAHEKDADKISSTIKSTNPSIAVIDSIQTIETQDASGEPGGTAQLKACTAKLLETAKNSNTAIILVGHVTKDGSAAGPKTMEHLVDAVLSFTGDGQNDTRIIKAQKNRFGATGEAAVFIMKENGLEEVKNPSKLFLSADTAGSPGSVVTVIMEGSQPILVEVQALLSKTSFGYPERRASGFDINRLKLLIAVLETHAGLKLSQYDVHINVVGGLEAFEPAQDLAVALAMASAYKNKAFKEHTAVFGEIDLAGRVRPVKFQEKRINACAALIISRVLVGDDGNTISPQNKKNIKIIKIKNILELVRHAG